MAKAFKIASATAGEIASRKLQSLAVSLLNTDRAGAVSALEQGIGCLIWTLAVLRQRQTAEITEAIVSKTPQTDPIGKRFPGAENHEYGPMLVALATQLAKAGKLPIGAE